MDVIYEAATETAKKIRKVLKENFPGVKFSVRSSTSSRGSSVHVKWTDGPIQDDVNDVIKLFASGYSDGDRYRITRFEWEGKIYNGADHIEISRKLSPDRKKIIQDTLYDLFESDSFGCYTVFQWNAAERILINEKKLEGYPPQKMNSSNVASSHKQKESIHSNVIDFTLKAAEIQVERFMNSLTAEQKLKLQILETMFSIEKVAEMLQTKQFTVDDLFRLTAEKIFDN